MACQIGTSRTQVHRGEELKLHISDVRHEISTLKMCSQPRNFSCGIKYLCITFHQILWCDMSSSSGVCLDTPQQDSRCFCCVEARVFNAISRLLRTFCPFQSDSEARFSEGGGDKLLVQLPAVGASVEAAQETDKLAAAADQQDHWT